MWCYFTTPYTMIRKFFYCLILLNSDKPNWYEKLGYLLKVLFVSAPVVWTLKKLHMWFSDNSQFLTYVSIALFINMIVGLRYHHKMRTFSWKDFFNKNMYMLASVIGVYILLDILRSLMGDNLIGEGFKAFIQITIIIYPISKALKNIYILNNKTFPPSYIMDKIYRFEKSGNMKELFNNDNENKL